MTTWLYNEFGTNKPIIGMIHLPPLPGDPLYKATKGMKLALNSARADLHALQNGGIDAVMFSNESSLPYLTTVETVTVAAMAAVIGELKGELKVPFGVDVLWDPKASLDLAVAVGAKFVREIFTGVYASDFGMWNTNCGELIRHQHAIGASDVCLFFNIVPEAASYLAERDLTSIARSTVFNARPDALCVSGLTAGEETSTQALREVKEAVPETFVFTNTGVRLSNVKEQLEIADGAVVGTFFKENNHTWNNVDESRVVEFMETVRALPGR